MTTSGGKEQVPSKLGPAVARSGPATGSPTPPSTAPVDQATPTRVMVEPAGPPTHPGTAATSAYAQTLPRHEPGTVLGEYLLAERIGKGGMGEVWKAVHRRLGRTVAIKLMLHHSAEAHSRFEREARLASTLDHPHIAKLYEYSQELSFIAMQYVEGVALHKSTGDRIRALRDGCRAAPGARAGSGLPQWRGPVVGKRRIPSPARPECASDQRLRARQRAGRHRGTADGGAAPRTGWAIRGRAAAAGEPARRWPAVTC